MTDLEDGFYWVRYDPMGRWTVARHCGGSFGGLNFFIGELDSWVREIDLLELDPRRIEREPSFAVRLADKSIKIREGKTK